MTMEAWYVFLLLTVLIGGSAAFLMGQNLALNWTPFWRLIPAALGLALAVRFLHYALFQEHLLDVPAYGFSACVLTLIASLSYRLARVKQTVKKYYWLYTRTSPFTWKNIDKAKKS